MQSDRYRGNMRLVVLNDLLTNSIDCFLKTAGPYTAIPIISSIFEGFGRLKGEIQLCGRRLSKLDEWLSYACFIYPPIMGVTTRGEMYERGAKSWSADCPSEGRSRDICLARCQALIDSAAKVWDPDLEIVSTRSLWKGDPECEWVWRKKGETSFDLGERIPFNQLIPDEHETKAIYNFIAEIDVEFWKTITEPFVLAAGEEKAIPALQESMHSLGESKGRKYATELGIEGSDIDSLSNLVSRIYEFLDMEGLDVIRGKGQGEKEIMACNYSGSLAMCLQMESFCNGICEAINPDYEFTYDRKMAKGDESCHWVIRKKPGLNQSEDPLRVLQMRFAKGDISKEEYLEMKALLEG